MSQAQVLVVEDRAADAFAVEKILSPLAVEVTTATSAEAALALLPGRAFDVILVDLVLPGMQGADFIRTLQQRGVTVPVIVITGCADLESTEECSALGVFDYLTKPVDIPLLRTIIRRALAKREITAEPQVRTGLPRASQPFPNLVGTSEAMREVYSQILKVAECDTNVILYGESGTGKELVARAIHYASPRKDRSLVTLDCTAISAGLMESEMFGHVKGAFTTALADREGVFQLAEKGTLFLDEVGEPPLPLQAKLLRVLQCREFRKVGGNKPIKVDVRIIAATNKDLHQEVEEGRFRRDLYYRLNVIPITIPPLRERKEDIPLLVDHFIAKFTQTSKKKIKGVSSRTMGLLLQYPWPGNVRELENCIERAGVMTDGSVIDVDDLRVILRSNGAPGWPPTLSREEAVPALTLRELEQNHIVQVLTAAQGNKTRAAELLGISLRGLHYKLKTFQQQGWEWMPESSPDLGLLRGLTHNLGTRTNGHISVH